MGKKWKRTLVRRRNNGRMEMPSTRPEPAVSNAAMVEEMKAAAPAPAPEPVEEVVAPEPEVVEEPVVEASAPAPKRRRTTRRKKTASED
jgi:hypothetical protein